MATYDARRDGNLGLSVSIRIKQFVTGAPPPSDALAGKTALVTGAGAGIGLETVLVLAAKRAHVVATVRNAERAAELKAELSRRVESSDVRVLVGDLASLQTIRRLAEEFRAKETRLDILINNAGVALASRRVTVDGFEETFAVNHLAPFLLTNLLLDLLKQSAPARIVNLASMGHFQGDLDFSDLQFARGGYSALRSYNRSKLANVMFTRELARRLHGSLVVVTCLHPGEIASKLWSGLPVWMQPLVAVARRLLMTGPAVAAGRVVYLATSPAIEGRSGGYYDNNVETEPSRVARDPALAKRLWEESARLVGLDTRWSA